MYTEENQTEVYMVTSKVLGVPLIGGILHGWYWEGGSRWTSVHVPL